MKFRRKSTPDAAHDDDVEVVDGDSGGDDDVSGPRDAEDVADDGVDRVDLGSLLVERESGRELRLQVEESTGQVQSVVLTGSDGAVEVRAFAAPRGGDLWSEVLPQIAADMTKRGGTATEREGRFGTELVCQLKVRNAEGATAVQPSRIVGVNGSRWLLRATLLGRPAIDFDATDWDDTLDRIVVRRGSHALPVGEPLPLELPDDARRVSPPAGSSGPTSAS